MTLISDLKGISKNICGNVLLIGMDFKTVNDTIDKNKNINNLYEMQFNGKRKCKEYGKGKRGKTISIKKIRKIFKKKRIDYTICNIEDIDKFLRTFISDSIYINKQNIYIYGNKNNIDIELLQKRYNRYNVKIVVTEYDKEVMLEIDTTKAVNNRFKDKGYKFIDGCYYVINLIGDILIN